MSANNAAALHYGIGLEGGLGPIALGRLASLAERLGYSSFWFNATTELADPCATLGSVLEATGSIEVGIGVLPVDAHGPEALARVADIAQTQPGRTVIGLGSGQIRSGAITAVADALQLVRDRAPGIRLAVGGYGPRMLALGVERADAILLNWLTLERLTWMRKQIEQTTAALMREVPKLYLYQRIAKGQDAEMRLQTEVERYRQWPAHRRHQAAMGFPRLIGFAFEDRSELPTMIRPYTELCNLVLRPLPVERPQTDEWETLVEVLAPMPKDGTRHGS